MPSDAEQPSNDRPVESEGRFGWEEPFTVPYDDLRELAEQLLNGQQVGHTLQPTALVNEAYIRVVKCYRGSEQDSGRFYCLAAKAMRSVLVDHARKRQARKRQGNGHRLPLDLAVAAYEERSIDLIALDEALALLEERDVRLTRLVELRFFCGLSADETAKALGVSDRTFRRDWLAVKAWLHRELMGS